MKSSSFNFWTLGGLPLKELLRRTACECWQDEVFGQAGRMAFYHFLAIFPALVVLLALSTRFPQLSDPMKQSLRQLSSDLLPSQISQLLKSTTSEVAARAHTHLHLISVSAAALWATVNGTWAMIYGLNNAYEVKENRSWRELGVTIAGLTASLAITGAVAVFVIFCGATVQAHWTGIGRPVMHILEWLVLVASLSFSFALLYRFAPSVRDHEWQWSTPGALCALVLWVGSTLLARTYFDHVNNYARTYGHLNGVVMLLLWLYLSNGAILIGGEMNSEIEKAVAQNGQSTTLPAASEHQGFEEVP